MKHIDELYSILGEVWELLQRGHQDSTSGIRTPVLATLGLDGQANARTVVLRRIEPGMRKLFVNTDSRSPKHAELLAEPQGVFVFFDAKTEIQLRIYTKIRIHQNNELAYQAWNELPSQGQQIYKTTAPPGKPAPISTSGLPASQGVLSHEGKNPSSGYENFAVMEAKAQRLDWLHFSQHGHRRAIFTWDTNNILHASWCYP